MKLQEFFDKDLHPQTSFVGLSVNETLFRLLLESESGKATKFRGQYKMTEETYRHLKLRALSPYIRPSLGRITTVVTGKEKYNRISSTSVAFTIY